MLDHEIEPIVQSVRADTGHAVVQASEWMRDRAGDTLIVCGDTPLLTTHTLQKLVAHHTQHGNMATVLTAHVADPSGMGRIARIDGVLTPIYFTATMYEISKKKSMELMEQYRARTMMFNSD